MMKKSQVYRRPYRAKRKKSILQNKFFWLSILILIILSGFFYFLFCSDFFQVKNIVIAGEKRVNKVEIESMIKDSLERKFWIFTMRNIFLVNLSQIKDQILENFPEINNLEIRRQIPSGLNLKIYEREEIAQFCQGEICFFLDKEGIIFTNAIPESYLLKIETTLSPEKLNLGKKIFEKEILDKILDTEKKLKDLDIHLESVLVMSDDNLQFKTKEGWRIFINPQKEIDWQITKLNVSLKEAIPKEKRQNLEYIDLRFGNFAYPKYKE